MSPIPDDPNWNELVARTRELVRKVGLEDFDQSFDEPGRFCLLDEQSRVEELREPDSFRRYVQAAVAFLAPIGPQVAGQLLAALNEQLAEPVARLELRRGDTRWDLLAPQTYEAVEIARGALVSVLQALHWEPFSGPSSTLGPANPSRRGPSA